MVDSRPCAENVVPRAAYLSIEFVRNDSDALQRWSHRSEQDIVGANAPSCSAGRVFPLQSLSPHDAKRLVRDARHVYVVKFGIGELERIDGLDLLNYVTEGSGLPPIFHSSALILSSTSALSASSVAISSRMSCGLRWVTCSPEGYIYLDSCRRSE
jgi:hypothetical protein